MLILALALLGCDGEEPVGDGTGGDAIRVRLVNPTEADPFEGVDAFRLELEVDGDVVESATFDVDEPWSLSGLTDYGKVRFRVAGLAGAEAEVVSYGRSAETAVVPGIDRDVPVTFLPVNELLPLRSDVDMSEGRFGHEVTLLPDGRALIHGGVGAIGERPKNDMQVYDPSEGAILGTEFNLGYQVSYPVVAWNPQQKLVFAGGASGDDGRLNKSAELDPATDTIESLDEMNRPRAAHCFEFVRDGYAVAIGGTLLALEELETLRSDGSGDGTLVWQEEAVAELDSYGVNSCVRTPDGRLFVQGDSVESTGVFSAEEDPDGGSVTATFVPMLGLSAGNNLVDFSNGASLIPLERSGDDAQVVWVGGGLELESGNLGVAAQPRLYNMDEAEFVMGFGADLRPRIFGDWDWWIEPGTVVLACGFTDVTYAAGQGLIELFEPRNGASLAWWEMPQARTGCESVVLKDGSILVTGGVPDPAETEPWITSILVPYLD